MKVSEFVREHPQYAIDFSAPIRQQPRIYDGALLDLVPLELEPDHPYHVGGRGRPNLNQTLTHSQCATCHRVLRNDLFFSAPSMRRDNIVFSNCRECSQAINSERYTSRADVIKSRRIVIWRYLAPRCTICGFDRHPSAMELHHLEHKEAKLAELITGLTLVVDAAKVEALLRESAKCIALCSNCHRMFHAGALQLPAHPHSSSHNVGELLGLLKSIE